MPEHGVTTSWKRSTDKVKMPSGASVHRSLAETSGSMRRESHSQPLSLAQEAKLAAWEDEGGATVLVEGVVGAHSLTQPSEHAEGDAPSAMRRILIVDDDVDAADSLASLLQSAGHGDTRVAYTGAAALAQAAEFTPTVLLVDLDLPDMSGYDVARHLSQQPQLQNLRLIALTTSSEHPGRELARAAGIERYLSKPVSSAALDEAFT